MKRRIVIKGEKVQDVGYRLFLLELTEQLGLRGFQAKNIGNHVECVIEGEEEKVRSFLEFIRSNHPEFASVRDIIDEEYQGNVMSVEGFYRLLSLQQLVKIVNAGLGMLEKQDETIEEIKALRYDLKAWMDERFSRIEREISEIKTRIGMS